MVLNDSLADHLEGPRDCRGTGKQVAASKILVAGIKELHDGFVHLHGGR